MGLNHFQAQWHEHATTSAQERLTHNKTPRHFVFPQVCTARKASQQHTDQQPVCTDTGQGYHLLGSAKSALPLRVKEITPRDGAKLNLKSINRP